MLQFKFLFELIDKLGLIRAVQDKLLRQPDPATDKLVIVLQELSKIYSTIDQELVRYLSLEFDPGPELKQERAVLLTLEGGQLQIRINEARGHCHKIKNIYDNYLKRWFHNVLSPDEASEMEALFNLLNNSDIGMIRELGKLTTWLDRQATVTLNLVDAGDYDQANIRIKEARGEVLPARQEITRAMGYLFHLQADFIEISGTV